MYTNDNNQCFWSVRRSSFGHKNVGLMGPAHATTGAGFGLLFLALFPSLNSLNISTPVVFILSLIAICGAVMVPDLDNTKASVITALGFTGKPASFIFRGTSKIVQSVVRTPKDPANPNPHRGFWHTIVGALCAGLISYSITNIPYKVQLPLFGERSIGYICALVITIMLMDIMNASLPNNPQSALLKHAPSFEAGSLVFSTIVTGALFYHIPADNNFMWLSFSISLGMIIHIIGDAFTTQGVPMFFPIIALVRGRMWWKTRFTSLEAKNKTLNSFIIIISLCAGMYGVYHIILHGLNW